MARTVSRTNAPTGRGLIHDLAALFVFMGLAFQSAVPTLSMTAMAGSFPVGHPLASFICHVPQSGEDGGEVPATGDVCCLICQAAQLAKGLLPPPALHTPTASAALSFLTVAVRQAVGGQASLHKLPRGPPVY